MTMRGWRQEQEKEGNDISMQGAIRMITTTSPLKQISISIFELKCCALLPSGAGFIIILLPHCRVFCSISCSARRPVYLLSVGATYVRPSRLVTVSTSNIKMAASAGSYF